MTSGAHFSRPAGRRPAERGRAARGGFTFLEILVVMAVAAVLLGLGVGFLVNVGKTTLTQQAAAILSESGQRCLNMSAGSKRATLVIRKVRKKETGDEVLQIQTAVQRTVLTSNFEIAPDNRPDLEWFVYANGPEAAKPVGKVRLEPMGQEGSAALLEGGYVDFGARSAFAMTDGLEVECWIMPQAGARGAMTLVKSDGDGRTLWSIRLMRDTGGVEAYRVALKVETLPADAPADTAPVGGGRDFATQGAPVLPGVWNHLRVSYDGHDVGIFVNGVARYQDDRRPKASASAEAAEALGQRLYVPPSGIAHLTLSTPESPFLGLVDTLNVAGIFRTDEDVRTLPLDVELMRETLPLRIVFANGRLDPTVHNKDRELRMQGPGDKEFGGWQVVRFGLYGNISPPYHVDPSMISPAGMGEVK